MVQGGYDYNIVMGIMQKRFISFMDRYTLQLNERLITFVTLSSCTERLVAHAIKQLMPYLK